ncbi:MAG TPA: serine/threonine-protein kinase [Polyangiaceae bacterium]|nr:serine/threonine-protein kinase [Polyangiaceae bacterium]
MSNADETMVAESVDFIEPTSSTDATAPMDIGEDLIGLTLNDTYVPERILGEGGMGRVYLARHTRIRQKRVAVKVLHPEFFLNAQVLARFQREAETAAAISHPNVVTVLDVDRTPHGLPYLVTEYLDGVELADHLKSRGKLSATTAVHITRQLCRGLGAAHQSQVIHRDVKPQNIFLVGDFAHGVPERPPVKVLDFGLSRFSDGSESQLTQAGCIMGTPAYMAPEQARGEPVDHRTDVYGAGVVLYTMLTGRPPFEEETPQATVIAAMNAEPPRPRSIEPTIPPHLELIIERAMARQPADRYQDMAAFEQALAGFEAESLARPAESLAPPVLSKQEASERRSRRDPDVDADVLAARPRLALFALAAAGLMISGMISAISGLEFATRYRFSRMELELLSLGIVGSLLTPATLWVLHVRRRVWESSSRVLALLGQVRAAVIAGISMYGLGLLALHVIDDFAVRVVGDSGLPAMGVTWPGWSLLLPFMALNASLTVVWCRRLATIRSGWRRRLALGFATGLGLLVFGALLFGGVWWRKLG